MNPDGQLCVIFDLRGARRCCQSRTGLPVGGAALRLWLFSCRSRGRSGRAASSSIPLLPLLSEAPRFEWSGISAAVGAPHEKARPPSGAAALGTHRDVTQRPGCLLARKGTARRRRVGMGISNVDTGMLRSIFETLANHYPERMGQVTPPPGGPWALGSGVGRCGQS